jgi:NADH-quinone oxidoreductase subunit A
MMEDSLLTDFGYIGLFAIASILVAAIMILLPVILRLIGIIPKKPNPVKNSPFECGMETTGKTWVRFNFRYYFYALMFITMDVLILFIYPWATNTRQSGYFGLIVLGILILLVIVGYIYAWKKKVLEWK